MEGAEIEQVHVEGEFINRTTCYLNRTLILIVLNNGILVMLGLLNAELNWLVHTIPDIDQTASRQASPAQ